MKLTIFLTALLMSSSVMSKDKCTPQIDAYLIGLEAGSMLAALSVEQKKSAIDKITNIKTMQQTLTDCQVVKYIPELKASNVALAHALKQLKTN
jgi:hypothetical protein